MLMRIQRGFTLIEVMVVLLLIGIVMSTVVLSIRTDDIEEHMEQELKRINTLLILAREESILQGQVMALAVSENKYRFEVRNVSEERWQPLQDEAVFRERSTVPGTHFVLVIDQLNDARQNSFSKKTNEADADKKKPEDDGYQRVTIEPSGEIFPFELILRKDDETIEYRLQLDEDGELNIIQPEDLS